MRPSPKNLVIFHTIHPTRIKIRKRAARISRDDVAFSATSAHQRHSSLRIVSSPSQLLALIDDRINEHKKALMAHHLKLQQQEGA
jgi:hypothetical protein